MNNNNFIPFNKDGMIVVKSYDHCWISRATEISHYENRAELLQEYLMQETCDNHSIREFTSFADFEADMDNSAGDREDWCDATREEFDDVRKQTLNRQFTAGFLVIRGGEDGDNAVVDLSDESAKMGVAQWNCKNFVHEASGLEVIEAADFTKEFEQLDGRILAEAESLGWCHRCEHCDDDGDAYELDDNGELTGDTTGERCEICDGKMYHLCDELAQKPSVVKAEADSRDLAHARKALATACRNYTTAHDADDHRSEFMDEVKWAEKAAQNATIRAHKSAAAAKAEMEKNLAKARAVADQIAVQNAPAPSA